MDRGWAWVVFAADFGAFLVCGGVQKISGIMQTILLEKYGESEAMTAWASSLFTAMSSLTGPMGAMLIDRTSCRVAVMTGGLIMSIGFLITALAPTLSICIFSFGLLAGFGSSLMFAATFTVLGFNFRDKLNLAQGIAGTGGGLGLFVLPPIIVTAQDTFGYTGVCLVISGICLQGVVFGSLMRPSVSERKIRNFRTRLNSNRQKHGNNNQSQTILKRYFKLLTRTYILCISISMLTYCGGIYTVYVHWPNFCLSKGFTSMHASYVLSVIGITTIIGRGGAGVIASFPCVDERLVYSGSFIITALPLVLFHFYSSSYIGHMVSAVIFGLFTGVCFSVITALNSKFVGIDNISAAIGIEFLFAGVGAVTIPVLSGYMLTAGWTYEYVFLAAGLCILVAAVFGMGTMCVEKMDSTSLYQDNKTIMVVADVDGENAILMNDIKEKLSNKYRKT